MTSATVEQIYTKCLAQASYFVVSEGEAAVIDPLRDPAPYLELAKKHNATIKYVIESHFHADFVSGHVDLAKATGAEIVYGPLAEPHFDARIVKDGEELPLGKVKFVALHTPGHTMESTTFLLTKEDGAPHAIFTGDTLFLGDAGRPDLAQKAASMTSEGLAQLMFKSLRTKIMPLPDETIVYPGHGAGSACGKNMSSETVDTLGNQKKTNYTLRADATEEEFVKELLDGLRSPPGYFGTAVAMNKGDVPGDHAFPTVMARGMKAVSVEEIETAIADGKLVIDVRRSPDDFCDAHIPGSVFVGTSGNLAVWAATALADTQQPFYVVGEDRDNTAEGVMRLARTGFDNCQGHLDGFIAAWKAAGKPTRSIVDVDPADAAPKVEAGARIVDVRGPGEWRNGHIATATHAPLCSRKPLDFASFVGDDGDTFVYCRGGYRSVVWLSLCLRSGIDTCKAATLRNVRKGWEEMEKVPALAAMISKDKPAACCGSTCAKA